MPPRTAAGSPSGGPSPAPARGVHSYEEALNALELAERLDLEAPVVLRSADLLVHPVLPLTDRPWPTWSPTLPAL